MCHLKSAKLFLSTEFKLFFCFTIFFLQHFFASTESREYQEFLSTGESESRRFPHQHCYFRLNEFTTSIFVYTLIEIIGAFPTAHLSCASYCFFFASTIKLRITYIYEISFVGMRLQATESEPFPFRCCFHIQTLWIINKTL